MKYKFVKVLLVTLVSMFLFGCNGRIEKNNTIISEKAEAINNGENELETVTFKDKNLRYAIRKASGYKICQAGDIFKSDVEKITELDTFGTPERIESIEGIEQLINLEKLTISDSWLVDLKPLESLKKLTYLDLNNGRISDIATLKNLTNLTYLNLFCNYEISDITSLKHLTNLKYLNLGRNKISDLQPLCNMVNLEELDVCANNITDVAPLKNLTSLKTLILDNNEQLMDISPLNNLANLKTLEFYKNNVSGSQ